MHLVQHIKVLKKMISFALEGITSCSVRPLRIITMAGLCLSILSAIYLIYVVVGYTMGRTVSGWATQIVLSCFFGGFQILCMGIIGEYIGKIYNEVKERPRFNIQDKKVK